MTTSWPAPVDAGALACPAAGHRDTYASGLTPERIPDLPSGYSFTFVKEDGCTPARFDPCQPVHYVLNPEQAPPGGVADVEVLVTWSRQSGERANVEVVGAGFPSAPKA